MRVSFSQATLSAMIVALVGTAACHDATAPESSPLTFKLAANCAAFDLHRSWTFFVDDQPVAETTMGSGSELTVQIPLGNRKVAWRWHRANAPLESPGPEFVTSLAGGSNTVRINCP